MPRSISHTVWREDHWHVHVAIDDAHISGRGLLINGRPHAFLYLVLHYNYSSVIAAVNFVMS